MGSVATLPSGGYENASAKRGLGSVGSPTGSPFFSSQACATTSPFSTRTPTTSRTGSPAARREANPASDR